MRRWMPHRQAYFPRLWVAAVIVGPLAAALAYVINPPWWLLAVGSVLLGFVASRLQWWLWRRRHPVLDPEVVARETARWN
jgi:4-hydroxybenzoate polyprenyltransferase